MSAQHDASEFVESDFQTAGAASNRPPSREEIELMVSEKQIKLAELKRAQEELERERAGLEELRRRQIEFQTGREEMLRHLTRGIGLLEDAELAERRDADQMARTLEEFRTVCARVQEINEQTWTQETFNVELTRALTTIENARMEWNAARLKFPVLAGEQPAQPQSGSGQNAATLLASTNFLQLCKIGFALTWPLVLLGAGIFVVLLLRR